MVVKQDLRGERVFVLVNNLFRYWEQNNGTVQVRAKQLELWKIAETPAEHAKSAKKQHQLRTSKEKQAIQ